MLPVLRFARVPGAFTMGEIVLRACERLRQAGIKPFAFVCN